MQLKEPCPDTAWWSDMLDGRCPEHEQAGPGAHLESCPRCQQTLERLTAGDSTWRDAARQLEQQPQPVALRRTMEELKAGADTGAETAGMETLPGVDVGFLRPSADPLHLGRLGGYEVLEVIGRGGMGVVLKALDPGLRRIVAIKVLAPPWASHEAARIRFGREARATAAVRHDHVVAIHSVDEVDGLPYLVMEYVAGESLQRHLEDVGPLKVEEIVRIGLETAEGLAAAHAQGLIHRDVKPANILLDRETGRVKLSDFGLARAFDDASLTQSGVIAGTPLYMAPEQAHGQPLDHRADLFSLGSVLYALCTGKPPFRAPTTMAVLKRVCDDTAQPIETVNRRIPAWLIDLIATLHAKNPADRFESAEEVARLLRQYLRHLKSPDRELPPVLPKRTALHARSWLVLAVVIVGLAMVPLFACAGLAYLLLSDGPRDRQGAEQPADQPALQELAADDPAFKDLVLKLGSGDVFERTSATKELARIKPNEQQAEVAQKLAALLAYDDQFSRTGAAKALAVWGTSKEVPALIGALDHKDVFTRREALKAIGPLRDKRAIAPVVRCFKEFHTREDAKTALRAMGSMAEKELLGILTSDDVFLQVDAIKTLRDIGTEVSLPALRGAAASNSTFITNAAREALEAIEARSKP